MIRALGILERSNALRFDKLFDLFFEMKRETNSIRLNDERIPIRIPPRDTSEEFSYFLISTGSLLFFERRNEAVAS